MISRYVPCQKAINTCIVHQPPHQCPKLACIGIAVNRGCQIPLASASLLAQNDADAGCKSPPMQGTPNTRPILHREMDNGGTGELAREDDGEDAVKLDSPCAADMLATWKAMDGGEQQTERGAVFS